MDADILCTLLAQRIDPQKFQLHGLKVVWMKQPTNDDLAIVDDVLKKYDALAGEVKVEADKELLIRAEEKRLLREQAISNLVAEGKLTAIEVTK
jgi:hypothetical protein